MKTSEFINIVKEIPSPEEVEVYSLFMNLNEEYFVEPVREVIVKRGGYTLLLAPAITQKVSTINVISHKPANMTLADCMDMLLELNPKNELLCHDESGAELWEDVAASKPVPEAKVSHMFYDQKGKRLFITNDVYLPKVLNNQIC